MTIPYETDEAVTRDTYVSPTAPKPPSRGTRGPGPLTILRDLQPWKERAACRGVGPDVFFVEQGGSLARARAYCESCPVVDECASYAVGESFGLWGGQTRNDRKPRPNKVVLERIPTWWVSRTDLTDELAAGSKSRTPHASVSSRLTQLVVSGQILQERRDGVLMVRRAA